MRITEQMAQRWLEQFEFPTDENSDDALATICEALQEYRKFRAIGTVEELQALKEKSVAKKPRWYGHHFCPHCNSIVYVNGGKDVYCSKCGQHLDWE